MAYRYCATLVRNKVNRTDEPVALPDDGTYNAVEEASTEYKAYSDEQDNFASFNHFPDAADFIEAVLKVSFLRLFGVMISD
ncbi:hypothetical protein HPULCUR_010914 [Helicostylum pulchrum]|uniref:Uncharacterized protein n=1 Tax=Helicostylum pulchrum TaxID=562976 RepID=A0ABP9YEL3_9FUNG